MELVILFMFPCMETELVIRFMLPCIDMELVIRGFVLVLVLLFKTLFKFEAVLDLEIDSDLGV